MGRTDTEEYANWESGFEAGQEAILRLMEIIREALKDGMELHLIETVVEKRIAEWKKN